MNRSGMKKIVRNPTVSIIIPCKELDDDLIKCVDYCKKVDYSPKEIIILPDHADTKMEGVKIITTGKVYPSIKRNIGIKSSRGEILAFIDSDAFPSKEWIQNAVSILAEPDVAIIGGPNILPNDSSLYEQVSYEVLYSKLGVFSLYPKKKYKYVGTYLYSEVPASNLLIKRAVFNKVGGFDAKMLTAEDAKVCWGVRKWGYKIVYSENVKVYHKVRRLFLPQIKRMIVLGSNRARLIKENVRFANVVYFLPSAFTLFIILGAFLSFFITYLFYFYLLVITTYFLIVLTVAKNAETLKKSFLMFLAFPLIHLAYGVGFIKGMLK